MDSGLIAALALGVAGVLAAIGAIPNGSTRRPLVIACSALLVMAIVLGVIGVAAHPGRVVESSETRSPTPPASQPALEFTAPTTSPAVSTPITLSPTGPSPSTPTATSPTASRPPAPGPQPCLSFPTQVTAPARASNTFQVTVTVTCPPPAGRTYWLIIRGDKIGEHQTTNYYPKAAVPSDNGTYIFESYVRAQDPTGTRNYLVVSVTEDTARNLSDEYINQLPPTAQIVSAVASTKIYR